MARYTGPVCRLCRREGIKLFLKGDRCLSSKCAIERRNTRPGQHGQARGRKPRATRCNCAKSRRYDAPTACSSASSIVTSRSALNGPARPARTCIQLLEMRLDNVVYRLGFADSRAQARQLVNHGHFQVNGRKTDIPSMILKPGNVVAVRERSRNTEYFKTRALMLADKGIPQWLRLDPDTLSGRVDPAGSPARPGASVRRGAGGRVLPAVAPPTGASARLVYGKRRRSPC